MQPRDILDALDTLNRVYEISGNMLSQLQALEKAGSNNSENLQNQSNVQESAVPQERKKEEKEKASHVVSISKDDISGLISFCSALKTAANGLHDSSIVQKIIKITLTQQQAWLGAVQGLGTILDAGVSEEEKIERGRNLLTFFTSLNARELALLPESKRESYRQGREAGRTIFLVFLAVVIAACFFLLAAIALAGAGSGLTPFILFSLASGGMGCVGMWFGQRMLDGLNLNYETEKEQHKNRMDSMRQGVEALYNELTQANSADSALNERRSPSLAASSLPSAALPSSSVIDRQQKPHSFRFTEVICRYNQARKEAEAAAQAADKSSREAPVQVVLQLMR